MKHLALNQNPKGSIILIIIFIAAVASLVSFGVLYQTYYISSNRDRKLQLNKQYTQYKTNDNESYGANLVAAPTTRVVNVASKSGGSSTKLNAVISDYGPIIKRGQTLAEYWKGTSGAPPTDGTFTTWAFFPNGDQIVTKKQSLAQYWLLKNGSKTWISGNLKNKWASCSTFPDTGVDTYTIKPDSSEEYAFIGYKLYVMSSSGRCLKDGENWKDYWARTNPSPSGATPFTNHEKLESFQFLDANSQMAITKDSNNGISDYKVWLIGANPTALKCIGTQPTAWHFCEGEYLSNRWMNFAMKPSYGGTSIYAVHYNPSWHIAVNGEYVVSLGINGDWSTFKSGNDGFGMREANILSYGGT